MKLLSRIRRSMMLWTAHRNGHKVLPNDVYFRLCYVERELHNLIARSGSINDGTTRTGHVGKHARVKLRQLSNELFDLSGKVFRSNLDADSLDRITNPILKGDA